MLIGLPLLLHIYLLFNRELGVFDLARSEANRNGLSLQLSASPAGGRSEQVLCYVNDIRPLNRSW